MNVAVTYQQDVTRYPPSHEILLANDTIEQLRVSENGDFSEVGFSGNGSEVNPYILENKILELAWYVPVSIMNTDAHFVIRNFSLHSKEGGYTGWGIKLSNVTNGRIESCSFFGRTRAIGIEESQIIELMNNTIHDVEEEAITLSYSQHVNISYNTVSITRYGIHLENTEDTILTHNEISESSINGIYSYIASSCRIANNTLSNSGQEGIYACYAPSHVIANNTLFNGGLFISDSFSPDVRNNTLDMKPILYLHNVQDSVYNGSSYSQAILYNCENVNITDGTFSEGIPIANSEYCRIENISISSPSYGIYFESSSWCNVTRCNISSATRAGIHFDDN
ncbi:MAG: right-handed parallel beta-helix repeat-containing protein [Candidatus Thorarchaeota archaeon]|nr:right-handed parallel beta-helix repeat-containing protein [Candidatus Thorarchaeota archaeon]